MKLYRVTAATCGYDQYDSFLVWANNQKEALDLCISYGGGRNSNFCKGADIAIEYVPLEPGVALGSFNAG